MEIRVVDDAPAAFRAAADALGGAIKARPDIALGLPAGPASLPLYDELAARRERGELDLGRAWAFALDELLLPEDHPRNFRTFAALHWPRAGLAPGRSEVPEGWHVDDVECNRYEATVVGAGGLELAILLLGADGGVASMQPGAAKDAPHVVSLTDETAEVLGVAERPLRAFSVGLAILLATRRLVVVATGTAQLRAARALTEGPADPRWPCSLLRAHTDIQVVLAAAAAVR